MSALLKSDKWQDIQRQVNAKNAFVLNCIKQNINCYSTYYHLQFDINLLMECQKDPYKTRIWFIIIVWKVCREVS